MGCGSSSNASEKAGVLLATPTFSGDETTKLFGGLLYRIVKTNTGEWAFFNNSKDYEFHIKYIFGLESKIKKLGDTKIEKKEDGIHCFCVVYPLETKMYVKGRMDGFESKLEALPLSAEYFAAHPEVNEEAYFKRLAPLPSK